MSDAVRRSGSVDFDKVLFLRDDESSWMLYVKPDNEKGFCIHPDKGDVNSFFKTLKQGEESSIDQMRQDLALKYYVLASRKPELKIDPFISDASAEELAKIERVNIFKTKETKDKPSTILCLPTIDGKKQKPREVSQQQWQRLWLADDMKEYKIHLAATLFKDIIREEQKQQEAVKNMNSEDKDVPVAQKGKSIDDASSKEEKEAEKTQLSPIMKQFQNLKEKHPDALLLFRCGDFYETYKEDAVTASKILGITLTKSSKQLDDKGKQLQMAGFPYHALDSYLPKLIRAGQRVAICDQLELPKTQRNDKSNESVNSSKTEEKVQKPQSKEEPTHSLHR